MKHLFLAVLTALSFPPYPRLTPFLILPIPKKIVGLSKFWSEAANNFAYFDKSHINWDSAYEVFIPKVLATKNTWDYYLLLKQFAALLKDGHTGIFEPGNLYKAGSRYKFINVENINKHFFVTNIHKADSAKVPLGSELLSINDVPLYTYLQRDMFPYIAASTEHQLWNDAARLLFYATDSTKTWQVKLKTPSGKIIFYTAYFHTYPRTWLRPLPEWKRSDFKKINDIGYFQANTFGDDKIISDFTAKLPELRTCKGIILDLRGNGGGSSSIGAGILKYFTDEKILTGSKWQTRENLSSFKAWGSFWKNEPWDSLSEFQKKGVLIYRGNYWYQGDTSLFENDVQAPKLTVPLIVLLGNSTASAAEDFLIILSSLKNRAVTIGQNSFGSTGQPLSFDMPGGGSARVCTKKDTYPDGREFVGYGIKPDIVVEKNINDIIAGRDTELAVALTEMKRLIK